MKKGATLRPHVMMYKEETQSVLMYVSDSWLATKAMLKVLEGFHHRAARQITGMIEKRVADGDWEYPPVVAALESAVSNPI